jgi:hypothetical protein
MDVRIRSRYVLARSFRDDILLDLKYLWDYLVEMRKESNDDTYLQDTSMPLEFCEGDWYDYSPAYIGAFNHVRCVKNWRTNSCKHRH